MLHRAHARANALSVTCSIKMVEPVRHTQPEPEDEPGAGTSLSCSDSSKSDPKMLLEVLRGPI